MSKYRKKPVVIEAVQLCDLDALHRVLAFLDQDGGPLYEIGSAGIAIKTLEGTMLAAFGDWIIKGIAGEFYPCEPDIFAATYEPVDASPPEGPRPTCCWACSR
jgi:hypothetical protein